MALRKASRKQAYLKIGLAGPSGSGKTLSALRIAYGMVGDWNKIAVIDSENGSAELYTNMKGKGYEIGEFLVNPMEPPYSPEHYIKAIDECVEAGAEVVIIDSATHEWSGEGGILSIKDSMAGNDFTKWGKLTPRHNAFINKILHSPAHFITTLRSKQDYVLQEKNGKYVPEKVGLKSETRDGVEYEFTLVFDIDIKHNATASKDRTNMFADQPEHVLSEEDGKRLITWAKEGDRPPSKEELEADRIKAVVAEMKNAKSRDEALAVWNSNKDLEGTEQFDKAVQAMKKKYAK